MPVQIIGPSLGRSEAAIEAARENYNYEEGPGGRNIRAIGESHPLARDWIPNGCRDWPNSQNQASFKNYKFEVETDTREGGRRIVVHEYPTRDVWDNEDMGRKAQHYFVNGYVYGDDADRQAELLLAACSSANAGLLVLPVRAPIQARCISVFSTFEADKMGRIGFEFEFITEPEGRGGLVSVALLVSSVVSAARVGLQEVGELFNVRFNMLARRNKGSKVPAVARDRGAEAIKLAGNYLAVAKSMVPFKDLDAAKDVDVIVQRMRTNAVGLAYAGQRGDAFEEGVFIRDQEADDSEFGRLWSRAGRIMLDNASDHEALASAMEYVAAYVGPEVTQGPDCASVRMEQAVVEEVAATVRRVGLITFAAAKSQGAFGSRTDAVRVRSTINAMFENEQERVLPFENLPGLPDQDAELAMGRVRDAAVALLSRQGAERPPVIRYRLPGSMPLAALTYMIYGDTSHDRDVMRRNHLTNPNFVTDVVEAVQPRRK